MEQGAEQVVDTLTIPLRQRVEAPECELHARWLKLADIALANAREEQAKVKEPTRPNVDNYKPFTGRSNCRAA